MAKDAKDVVTPLSGLAKAATADSDSDAEFILDEIPVGILIFQTPNGNEFFGRFINPQARNLLGLDDDGAEAVLTTAHCFDNGEPLQSQLKLAYHAGKPISFKWQLPSEIRRDRYLQINICPIRPTGGRGGRIVCAVTDRTDEQSAQRRLMHKALHDSLTGLPNRKYFLELLERAVSGIGDSATGESAILIVNVDRFQSINETFGHRAGDRFLLAFAGKLRSCLRAEDVLARLSGDEFAILINGDSSTNIAKMIAKRIHRLMDRPFAFEENEIYLSVSIGMTSTSNSNPHPEDLIRDADFSMHEAKGLGGGTEMFRRDVRPDGRNRFQVESALRKALGANALELAYQPIVELRRGRPVGFEALCRWTHPEWGPVSPGEFIPIAEQTGLISELGRWCLFQACNHMAGWCREKLAPPNMKINVNASGVQFTRDDLVAATEEALANSGLPAAQLQIEITESAIMGQPEIAADTLGRLRALGCVIALDDFGTGYSSLSYLHRFPIDILKIDRSFIGSMAKGNDKHTIVSAVMKMAQSLGMEVVAEGIETRGQVKMLRRMRCKLGQGFFYSKPVPAESARRLLRSNLKGD